MKKYNIPYNAMPKICTSKNQMVANLNLSLDFNGYVKKLKPNNKAKK